MRQLVITADDFGLAEAVNEAVEIAHRRGVLTSASLMVGAPAAADAVARARRLGTLAVGLHLVLVDGPATLPRVQIPDLADEAGLRRDLPHLGLEIALRPELRRQLRAEITAQFEGFAATGLRLDHVDAHKHFHLHPLVAADIIAIGKRYGMRALRVPAEPKRVVARVDRRAPAPWTPLDPWVAVLGSKVRRAGLLTCDAVFGWAWSGALTRARIVGLLENLPTGVVELYSHPAIENHFPGHAVGYRYREEFEALCAPDAIAAIAASHIRLGSYADAFGC